eukprot:gene4400-5149_t
MKVDGIPVHMLNQQNNGSPSQSLLVPPGFNTPSPLRKSQQRRGSFSSILRRSSIVSMARRSSRDPTGDPAHDERMAKFLNNISLRERLGGDFDDSSSFVSDLGSQVDIADYDPNDWFLQEDSRESKDAIIWFVEKNKVAAVENGVGCAVEIGEHMVNILVDSTAATNENAVSAKQESERFLHYFNRYFNHDMLMKHALKMKPEEIEDKMNQFRELTNINPDFLSEALELLVELFFEYQQANAEGITELLSEGTYINVALINAEDMKNRIRVTKKYITNLVKSIEEGLGLDNNMGLKPQE